MDPHLTTCVVCFLHGSSHFFMISDFHEVRSMDHPQGRWPQFGPRWLDLSGSEVSNVLNPCCLMILKVIYTMGVFYPIYTVCSIHLLWILTIHSGSSYQRTSMKGLYKGTTEGFDHCSVLSGLSLVRCCVNMNFWTGIVWMGYKPLAKLRCTSKVTRYIQWCLTHWLKIR